MKNSVKYNFKDFTFENYELIIEQTKKNHIFSFFDEIKSAQNFVLWRHDIDFSMENALILSEIEKKCGVKSTYFIHLHSDYYNFFDSRNKIIIQKIIENGHNIGLHLDCEYYTISSTKELEDIILFEKEILEKIINETISVFSFHNPNSDILKFDNEKYAGVINTYGKQFNNINYCSDSNGYWRHKRLYEFLVENKENNIQVLTHPEWWSADISSPKQRIDNLIQNNSRKKIDDYNNFLVYNNRLNIDWNE